LKYTSDYLALWSLLAPPPGIGSRGLKRKVTWRVMTR
jgi:hypothetical protein